MRNFALFIKIKYAHTHWHNVLFLRPYSMYIHICQYIHFGIISNSKILKQILHDNLKGTRERCFYSILLKQKSHGKEWVSSICIDMESSPKYIKYKNQGVECASIVYVQHTCTCM